MNSTFTGLELGSKEKYAGTPETGKAEADRTALLDDLSELATEYSQPTITASSQSSETTIAGIPFNMPDNASTAEWAGMTTQEQVTSNATAKSNEANNRLIAQKLGIGGEER